jgi:hypothetical protein
MNADTECRDRLNKVMQFRHGDQVQTYQSVKSSDPATKRLPPRDSISMKANITYVRAVGGPYAGSYCWVPTVNIR